MRTFINRLANRLARGIAVFVIRIVVVSVCLFLLGGVRRQIEQRLGVTYEVAMFLECGITLTIAFGLMIATRVNPTDPDGLPGFFLRRARRIVTGTTLWDWAVLIGMSFGWHFINNAHTLHELGPAIGTTWVVSWFVVSPQPRQPKTPVARSDRPRTNVRGDATTDDVVREEPVEQLTAGN